MYGWTPHLRPAPVIPRLRRRQRDRLQEGVLDPLLIVEGGGRRVCFCCICVCVFVRKGGGGGEAMPINRVPCACAGTAMDTTMSLKSRLQQNRRLTLQRLLLGDRQRTPRRGRQARRREHRCPQPLRLLLRLGVRGSREEWEEELLQAGHGWND